MNKFLFLFLVIAVHSAHAKLLDKVAGVINDKVFTLSEINRIQSTISARKEINPFVYTKDKYSKSEILKLLQKGYIIKDKLSEQGFIISDDSVESRIKDTEKRLGLSHNDLLDFLATKNITYNEYFELIREAMEFNVFNRRIIAPLVNITTQEVKNFYYKSQKSSNTLAFKYEVLDFNIAENASTLKTHKQLPYILEEYQKTGNIPEEYKEISTNDLGKLSDDDLPKDLSAILKQTGEGEFSKPYVKNGVIHVFFLKKKDLTESSDFLKKKDLIFNKLFLDRSTSLSKNWFNRELLNYYVLENL